ncbi:MAG: amino acid adenylation domain-containing protein [Acidobacteriota bacterium]|nr:amino acid adenylation domain-containing protein [Acidobacteriota bacterium]
MTPITQFLAQMRRAGVRLYLEDDQLRFNAPREVMNPALIAELKTRKPQIITFLKQAQNEVVSQAPRFPKQDRQQPLPLSFPQQRLWFLDKLDGAAAPYNEIALLDMQGDLNVPALSSAFTQLIERHEILRTTFALHGDAPVQVIGAPYTVTLTPEDCPVDDVERKAEREMRRAFDLEQGPLLRLRLLRTDGDQHTLILVMHHIIGDAWSTGLLQKELGSLYPAALQNQPLLLPSPAVQYADYAAHQQRRATDGAFDSALSYWKKALAGLPAGLDLPYDKPRPTVPRFAGTRRYFEIDPQATAGLNRLTQQTGATLFMVLQAAFAVFLKKQGAGDDIPIGSPIAGRDHVELESMVGFFVNMIVLRNRPHDLLTFRQLVEEQTKVTALEAFANQEAPFERVVEVVGGDRPDGRNPLFQVVFALQNIPDTKLELPSLTLSGRERRPIAAKFDLTLELFERNDRLSGCFEFDLDLFEPRTISDFISRFQRLLARVAENPDQTVASLNLLSSGERKVLLTKGRPKRQSAPTGTIHGRFSAIAREQANRIALTAVDGSLTYGQLENKANQLARRLIESGVKPQTTVGLYLPAGPEQIITVLGVLKAGGIYVPVSTDQGAERVSHILQDSGATLLIYSGEPPQTAGCPGLDLDEFLNQSDAAVEPPVVPVHPQNGAYVIYTSGTTGRPKGVLVSHAHVLRLFDVTAERFGFGPDDVWSMCHSYAFDFSVWEMWGALLFGGRLVIPDGWTVRNPPALQALLQTEGVTMLSQTPSAFYALSRESESPGALRLVIFGGEALDVSRLDPWFQRFGADHPKLINMYGITETTVHVTWRQVRPGDPNSLGPPLPDLALYLVDSAGDPVPEGVRGEILVGGAGPAVGYLNRPALTAKRFIPDPFSDVPGARLYRSGDLGRFDQNDELLYLGRSDDQFQLRGFRIEPGEIEAAMRTHSSVRDAVVLPIEQADANQIVAFYQADDLSPEQLTAYLHNRLPGYMVPTLLQPMAERPLTPNGKLDRKTLLAQLDTSRHGRAPEGDLEKAVAEIWAQILEQETIPADVDFFSLGGHSLSAARVLTRLKEDFPLGHFGLRDFFHNPTVAALARQIGNGTVAEPIDHVPNGRAVGLSSAQQRLWFLDRLETDGAGRAAYHIPLALTLYGPLDRGRLQQAFNQLVERHPSLRTCFPMIDGQPVQQILPPFEVTFELEDIPSDAEVGKQFENHSRRPFDLGKGPLFRVHLIKQTGDKHALLVNMHHAIADEFSLALMLEELQQCYSTGDTLPQPSAVTYRDFTAYQHEWLQSKAASRQVDYWRVHLSGAPSLLELPTDMPRPASQQYEGDLFSFNLNADLYRDLKTLALKKRTTPYVIQLAAFAMLLSRYSGQTDLVVGTPVTGRDRPELERLFGFLVNTLALRFDLHQRPTFSQMIDMTVETVLNGMGNADLPFEKIVEQLQPERNLSHAPIFQVMFVQQQNLAAERFGDLTMEALENPARTSKFDLTLFVREAPDGGIDCAFEFSTALFHRHAVAAMADHYRQLLQEAIGQPGKPYDRLPIMEPQAYRIVTEDTNKTRRDYPRQMTAHQLFERTAAQQPDTDAVVDGDRKYSYQEINQRANQLARRLTQRDVRPESRVGVYTDRSVDMTVAVLAILKAGACYVPMDPGYPKDRLTYMAANASVKLIVTQDALEDSLPVKDIPVLNIDAEAAALQSLPEHNLDVPMSSDNLLYTIYTSGSTGRPKAIAISHFALVNLIQWHLETLRGGLGVLQFASLSFDASFHEMFAAWGGGGTLFLVDETTRLDAVNLLRTIGPKPIGKVILPVVVMQLWAETFRDQPELFLNMIEITTTGEQLQLTPPIAELFKRLPHAELHNHYGPSETHVVTAYTFTDAPETWPYHAPIGYPVANTQIYMLDHHLEPTPPGVIGDLYIGGYNLARGYLNRYDLTADRFLPDPFSKEPGSRMYRTGDRARYLRTKDGPGPIEFLGRLDHQVKIRGFRVEPQEIEAVLTEADHTAQAVVLVKGQGGDKQLVAYVTLTPNVEPAPTVSDIRRYLSERLPHYMVPSAIVMMEAFPLTPNRKIDRAALPEPDAEGAGPDYVAPEGFAEQLLQQFWLEFLGGERLSVEANFFHLGGHSLTATRLVNRVSMALDVDLPLRALFERPTIRGMAVTLQDLLGDALEPMAEAVLEIEAMDADEIQTRLQIMQEAGDA